MIFTSCDCGEPIIVGWESGDRQGYYRTDCKCGKIAMTECTSIGGETTILDNNKELEEFIIQKGLNKPSNPLREEEKR